jgi:serine protease Do
MDGEVVGVNTAILSPNGGSIGIGFSMASNVVTKVVKQLKEFGETRRGWLGVRIQNVTEDMVEAVDGLDEASGAMVTDVPEGPAKEAGLQAGDVITMFDGNEVKDVRGLVRQVGNTDVGKTVRVIVLRDGATQTLKVTLGRRETAESAGPEAVPAEPETVEKDVLGLTVTPLTEEMRSELGVAEGTEGLVVTKVDEASKAFEKGLRAGDVLTEASQQKLTSVDDLETRIAEAKEAGRKSLLLLVRRGGEPRFVALNIED